MPTLVTNITAPSLPAPDLAQAYNAMDACLTFGIHEALAQCLERSPDAARVYAFERAMQGPAFTMACRGIAVDERVARITIGVLKRGEERLHGTLQACATVWGVPLPFNPLSPPQVARLLFEATGETPYHTNDGTVTMGEAALLRLQVRSPIIGVMAHLILRIRELRKLRGFLAARRSPDGRLRSSFNVGATTSGRWSFSKNCFGDGLNFGNIPKAARAMFVADPGMVLINADLRQAESLIVAHLADDPAYIAAHETGDVHSAVARDLWPSTDPRAPGFLHGMSRRDVAKRIGHGTNYGIGERKSAIIAKLPIAEISRFRRAFFARYPGVAQRIDKMPKQLAASNLIISFLGRPHRHLGHPDDPETVRSALADEPQGAVADILNIALWRLWYRHDVGNEPPRLQLLSQAYDSVLLQCHASDLEAARVAIAKAFHIEACINGRTFVIPHSIGTGTNWKEASA